MEITPVRFPRSIFERANALIPRVKADPALSVGRVSASSVIRLAVIRGLEVLERDLPRI